MARTNREDRRSTNRDSRIVTTSLSGGRVQTRTIYRNNDSIRASVETEKGSTSLRIRDPFGGDVVFSGREARTIYRALQRHYEETGRSTY